MQAAEGQNVSMKVNQDFEDRIMKIKELCIATFLLDMTRSLKYDEK
jgi:hypothetical protein